MATGTCSECNRFVDTGAEFFPFCNESCKNEDLFRRARRGEVTSTPRVKRAGRLTGF